MPVVRGMGPSFLSTENIFLLRVRPALLLVVYPVRDRVTYLKASERPGHLSMALGLENAWFL